ncbi:uncharacterized protein LOC111032424 isoform X2 [Myzus persicae]|uniref:uncharacterized protein LOC111032424 isoform X2 n=1 Tax=Myzus persicae TaxID=13164 RepID=UPI000B9397D8|nr:uncharacterized protein LOC111032424 isoform X2 [Myzus persicae]
MPKIILNSKIIINLQLTMSNEFHRTVRLPTAILQANNSFIPESSTDAQELSPQTHITTFNLFDNIQSQNSSVENQNNTFVNNDDQMDLLHHISPEQMKIKSVLNRISSNLDNSDVNSIYNTSTCLETDFLSNFSINNLGKFNGGNDFILNDLGFVDKLAYFF